MNAACFLSTVIVFEQCRHFDCVLLSLESGRLHQRLLCYYCVSPQPFHPEIHRVSTFSHRPYLLTSTSPFCSLSPVTPVSFSTSVFPGLMKIIIPAVTHPDIPLNLCFYWTLYGLFFFSFSHYFLPISFLHCFKSLLLYLSSHIHHLFFSLSPSSL